MYDVIYDITFDIINDIIICPHYIYALQPEPSILPGSAC